MTDTTKTPEALPTIGSRLDDGVFCDVLTNTRGELYMLVLLDAQPRSKQTWEGATAWAEALNASLPNRMECTMLFAHLKAQLEPEWHWTCETLNADASFAWCCYFFDGNQFNLRKSYEGCARAVRRLPLQSFNPLIGAA